MRVIISLEVLSIHCIQILKKLLAYVLFWKNGCKVPALVVDRDL